MSNDRRRHITPTHRIGRHIAAVAIILIALAACHYLPPFGGIRGGLSGRLGGAIDTLVNSRPDSALTLLNSIAQDTAEMSRRDLMRYYLLRTNAENKCDTVLTARHAALMRRVCDYYDNHPSSTPQGDKRVANDRMLAHYLLGRCYSDMHEAPAALQEFLNAAEAADTTSTGCDYKTLSLIHSQCGGVYSSLFMKRQSLEEDMLAAHYALVSKDTFTYFTLLNLIADDYGNLGKPDSLINIKKECETFFRKKGYNDFAAVTIGSCAYAYLQKGMLDKAKDCLDIYKMESGLFLGNGEVQKGHEIYYFTMAKYYMADDILDSAQYYFRKELTNATDNNNRIAAMQGLAELYGRLHDNDSVAKYATLCYALNDSTYKESKMAYMLEMKASFDYTRLQKSEAVKNEQLLREQQTKRTLLFLLILAAIISAAILRTTQKNNRVKIEKLNSRLLEYSQDRQELHKREKELADFLEKEERLRKYLNELSEKYSSAVIRYREERYALEGENEKLKRDSDVFMKRIEELKVESATKTNEILNQKGLIERNLQIISTLSEKVKGYESIHPEFKMSGTGIGRLSESGIFSPFNEYLHSMKRKPSRQEWANLLNKVGEEMPSFKTFLTETHHLSKDEYKLCILLMFNCNPGAISTIMEKSMPYVSKTRKKLLKKLFNKNGQPDEFDKMLRTIF